MSNDFPIANLLERCETVCVVGCCGMDAFDFRPSRIAAFLTATDGDIESIVAQLRAQLERINAWEPRLEKAPWGPEADRFLGEFTPAGARMVAAAISENLDAALEAIKP